MRCISASKSNLCTPARLHFMQVTVCPTCTCCQTGEPRSWSMLWLCTHLGLADPKGFPEDPKVLMVEFTMLHHQSLGHLVLQGMFMWTVMQLGRKDMQQDGPLQGLLHKLEEIWQKSPLVSLELVAITGNDAASPCSTFKPSYVILKQGREPLA